MQRFYGGVALCLAVTALGCWRGPPRGGDTGGWSEFDAIIHLHNADTSQIEVSVRELKPDIILNCALLEEHPGLAPTYRANCPKISAAAQVELLDGDETIEVLDTLDNPVVNTADATVQLVFSERRYAMDAACDGTSVFEDVQWAVLNQGGM